MLVLTRKIDEEIKIGEQIVVRVLAIKDGQIKLGIAAPRSISVFRGELYAEAQRQNEAASRVERSAVAEAAATLSGLNVAGTEPKS
jgi:carbon storage regulator